MKILYVVRHGKAEDYAQTDFARRLTPKGCEHIAATARRMAADGMRPQRILASSAARTLQTAEIFAREFSGIKLETDKSLYSGDQNTYLNRIAAQPDTLESLMVVGHNPSVSYLLASLTGSSGFAMRKGDAARLIFDTDRWEDLYILTAKLDEYIPASVE